MADDPNPALRAELVAAQAVLAPQIRGLTDLAATSISPDLRVQVELQVAARTNRMKLIQAVLTGLDAVVTERAALEADGYPALPAAPILGSLFSELNEENSDLDAAVAVFASENLTADLANSTHTPQPVPPKG